MESPQKTPVKENHTVTITAAFAKKQIEQLTMSIEQLTTNKKYLESLFDSNNVNEIVTMAHIDGRVVDEDDRPLLERFLKVQLSANEYVQVMDDIFENSLNILLLCHVREITPPMWFILKYKLKKVVHENEEATESKEHCREYQ